MEDEKAVVEDGKYERLAMEFFKIIMFRDSEDEFNKIKDKKDGE